MKENALQADATFKDSMFTTKIRKAKETEMLRKKEALQREIDNLMNFKVNENTTKADVESMKKKLDQAMS